MLDPRAGRRRRRVVLPPRRRPLPRRRPADRDGAHDAARRARSRKSRRQVSRRRSKRPSTRVEGINELRSVSAPGQSMRHRHVQPRPRHRHRRAGRARPRRAGAAPAARRRRAADRSSSRTTTRRRSMTIALSGNLSIRELTEIADKIVKVAARALAPASARCRSSAASSARSTSGSTPTASPPTSCRSPRCATRCSSRTPTCPAATSPTDVNEQTLRTMGRFTDAAQFNDLVIATRNGAPIRVRDIGRAEDGTKEQRSFARLNGVPTVVARGPPPVGRQHRRGDRGGQGQPRARRGRSCPPASSSRSSATSRRYIYAALHEINVHLVLGSILACLVVFAFMRNWRATIIAARRDPGVGDLDLRHDGGARLHAQQRDDARAGADGRHRHRRRDRRAGEHLPLRRGEG